MKQGPRDMTPADQRRLRDDTHDDHRLVVTGGKPDGRIVIIDDDHRTLDGEPRPPEAWERANSAIRSEAWSEESKTLAAARQRQRQALPLPEQLAAVMRELLTIQSTKALELRPAPTPVKRKGTEHEERLGARLAHRPSSAAVGPDRDHSPHGDDHGDVAHAAPHEIDRRLRVIALEIEAIWELVDEHRGLAHKSYALMSKDEKDRLLLGGKFRGMTPEEIHALHPELGAPRTIRRIRNEAGQTSRGLDRPARRAA